jgi:cytochrome c556
MGVLTAQRRPERAQQKERVRMKSKTVLEVAGGLAVAAMIAVGANSLVQAADSGQVQQGRVQLADAAQMEAVKQRQELMKSIGGNTKKIADFLKESKGTKEEAQAAAAKIGELAGQIPEAFKVEASLSEMDAVGKNRGKPEIWMEWEEFQEYAENLGNKAEALETSFQGDDIRAVQTAFGDMGKNGCGQCHEEFRGPKVE